MRDIEDEKAYTRAEAAAYLGVTVRTLMRWRKDGLFLPDFRTPGGQTRYYGSTIRAGRLPVERDQ